MAGSKSTSTTTLKDKQAEEFKALRGPFADLLSGGFGDISRFLSGDMTFGGVSDLGDYRAPMSQMERDALYDLQAGREPTANDVASEDRFSMRCFTSSRRWLQMSSAGTPPSEAGREIGRP